MRWGISVMLGAMLTLGSAAALHAQEVTWEDIGPVEGVAERLTLVVGPTASTDTVFVAGGSTDLRRYPPGGPWSEALHGPALPAVDFVVTKEGYYLAESIPMDRSTDGGRTWQRGVYDSNQISCFLQTTLPVFAGAVVACRRIAALLRSDDGGATWATLPITPVSGEGTGSLWDLAEVPVSAALPAGRLLAATSLGVVYSDDGAETWRTSDLWRLGEVWILARQNDPTHPFGGTVYASADAAIVESPPALWASEDGGATWAQRIVFDMPSYGYEGPYPPASVAAGDDGSVWMGLNQLKREPGPVPSLGTLVRSMDGGVTWTTVGTPPEEGGTDGWGGYAANDLLIDRRGVLWAATDRGVYRTTTAVVAVGSEESPPGKPAEAFVLEAPYPNPSAGSVAVPLVLPETAEVRVAVYDVLGRTVVVLAEGTRAAGPHALTVETAGWPAGVYVVRATVGGVTATRRVTVAR